MLCSKTNFCTLLIHLEAETTYEALIYHIADYQGFVGLPFFPIPGIKEKHYQIFEHLADYICYNMMYTIETFETLNIKFSSDGATQDQIRHVGTILHYFIRMKLNGNLNEIYYTSLEGFRFDLRCLVLEVIHIFFIYFSYIVDTFFIYF